jgi:hypothetical protein
VAAINERIQVIRALGDVPEEDPAVESVTSAETQILIRALRSQISGPPPEMQGEADDLTYALMLDLSRLKGRVNRLRAPVTLWGGPGANVPLEASIDVWLNSSGDVLRDVAVVALAVGRVVQYHDTVVTGLYLTIVSENGPREALNSQVLGLLSFTKTRSHFRNS